MNEYSLRLQLDLERWKGQEGRRQIIDDAGRELERFWCYRTPEDNLLAERAIAFAQTKIGEQPA